MQRNPAPEICGPRYWLISGLVLLSLSAAPVARAGGHLEDCGDWLARLSSLQGKVDAYKALRNLWLSAVLDHRFCFGDKVRTWEKSRALLHLKNETFVRLDQNTTLQFPEAARKRTDWLDLLRGMVYFISRVPYELNIRTPFVNATIKGTEFAVRVTDQATQIDVFEGLVIAENAKGRLTLGKNQSALARRNMAPVLKLDIRPEDAVHWTLYYLPVLDLDEARYAGYPAYETIRAALRRYRAGDVAAALAALESLDTRERQILVLRAGLLLSVGRVDEAQSTLQPLLRKPSESAEALAMQAIVELARNHKQRALELATEAVHIDARSAAGYRALSYAQQADFDLDQALASARKALELGENNANDWARIAELHLMLGRRRQAKEAAEKAVALQPDNPLLRTVQGFALLERDDTAPAERIFQQAITADPGAPLPRFGRGLARIRQGDLDGGTEDISIATALDPRNSLMRSYLGKAYYEQKRNRISETQYGLAKQFDPKDPTPWFYDAIKNQTENRPVPALRNMQKAIELNDNRAVYRSRQMHDEDEAARSANLARIYDNLYFGQRARLEAWKSLAYDPRNFSAHRFLADSYANQQHHDVARVSELLQSQLLQPINFAPLQAELAETNLAILQGMGPSNLSFNEFNPMFTRNGLGLLANALWGTNGTVADDVVVSGIHGPFSGSAGQFHYSTNGIRPNNDLEHNIYNTFGQWAITPDLNIQAELRSRRTEAGDLTLSALEDPNTDLHNSLSQDSARFGGHFKLTASQDLLASVVFHETEYVRQEFFPEICFSGKPPCPPADYLPPGTNRRIEHAGGYSVEGQHIYTRPDFKTIAGFGYVDNTLRITDRTDEYQKGQVFNQFTEFDITDDPRQVNGYLYVPTRLGRDATVTLGVSYEDFDESGFKHSQVNPKFGLSWSPFADTTFRAAAFRVMKRPFVSNQTIEPTQLAGFNQFFDDPDGSASTRYGFGIDQRLGKRWFTGVELSWRQVTHVSRKECPIEGCDTFFPSPSGQSIRLASQEKQDEEAHRAYLYWTPADELALAAEYRFEGFDRDNVTKSPSDLETHFIPLTVSYFHPAGPFFTTRATYVRQSVDPSRSSGGQEPGGSTQIENFWTTDVSFGYRLPRRLGQVSINALNIFNEDFRYQGSINPEQPWQTPLIQSGRSIYARINLWLF